MGWRKGQIVAYRKYVCPKILRTGTHDWVMGFWMWSHEV